MSDPDKSTTEDAYADADAKLRQEMRIGQTWSAQSRARVSDLRFPDFLVIGAQKAGTSWLYRNLNYHPDVWLPPIKEVNYFNEVYLPSSDGWESGDRLSEADQAEEGYRALARLTPRQMSKQCAIETIRENSPTDDWYGRIFAHAGDDMVCGEVTPEYALLPRVAITRILNLNAAIKAIIVLRDPIDRVWSNARMTAFRSGVADAAYFLADEHWHVMVGRSNYPAIIARWNSVLPKENFSILSFDTLSQSPMTFLEELCTRIGIRYDARFFPIADRAVREGLLGEIPDGLYQVLRDRMRFVYDGLMRCVPEIAEPWVRRHYL